MGADGYNRSKSLPVHDQVAPLLVVALVWDAWTHN